MNERPRRATLGEVLRIVLSAFIGVRGREASEQVRVTPVQVIVIAVMAAALFVLGLITVVRLITR